METRSPMAARIALPDGDRSAWLAREFTRETLRRWRYPGCLDEALLVVSELVTNAVLHGHGVPVLRLLVTSGGVRVEVSDDNPRHPVARRSGADGGWGLTLVERLTAEWGVAHRDDGKVVWCELAARPAV